MRRAAAIALLVLSVGASPAHADPQDIANDIAREMMSPYCPGITLHDCPSDASHDLRRRIAGWASDGMTKDDIWQRLESEFGSDIRATPSADGAGLGAWLLPVAAGLAAVAVAGTLAVKWVRRGRDERPEPVDLTPEQRQRLDLELAALRDQGS